MALSRTARAYTDDSRGRSIACFSVQSAPSGFNGRWVEIVYEQSLTAPVERPTIEFLGGIGGRSLLPSAVFGRAKWLGVIPNATREIRISVAAGASSFRVVEFRTLRANEVWARAVAKSPWGGIKAIASSLSKWHSAERLFRRAIISERLKNYGKWKADRGRSPDWRGFDAPSVSESKLPVLLSYVGERTPEAATVVEKVRGPHQACKTVFVPSAGDTVASLLADRDDHGLVMVLRADRTFSDGAAAIFAASAARSRADVFYSDEETEGPNGISPVFKPDWSPTLALSKDLVGYAWAARIGWLRRKHGAKTLAELAEQPLRPGQTDAVEHIARPLMRRSATVAHLQPVNTPSVRLSRSDPQSVSLIIPTHDRRELLEKLICSLQNDVEALDLDVVIVDNQSRKSTKRFLQEVATRPGFRIISDDRPFNFSALCNRGAMAARSDALVFLNDDVEPLCSDWLPALLKWLSMPTVGAVGALLLYPDGKLQHRGLVLGIEDGAAHFERAANPDDPDLFGRADVPHEVSAVTGACLAVARSKFEAVGGFDEANFPIEFSDVDLCLRLKEEGWVSIVEPAAKLIHREGATRKMNRFRRLETQSARTNFHARWYQALKKDPYFHPVLSLDCPKPLLG